ncbi:MAG: hypothetical protein V4496_03705 [Pseudomonadota bacterium]
MAVTLFGSSLGYKPEQSEFANLSRIAVAQKFRKVADEGFSNNQESVVSVIEDLMSEGYDFSKLSAVTLAEVDRKCENVGLNRKHVVNELEQQIARFRDNFKPSMMRPGRM